MQEKIDGRRIMIRKTADGQISGFNRRGLPAGLPMAVVEAAKAIVGAWLMDGELIGRRYVAFDLIEADGDDLRGLPCIRRLAGLQRLLAAARASGAIGIVEMAGSAVAKRQMFERLRREGREGVVFKRADSPYRPGRPASGGDQLKFKFFQTASFIVASHAVNKRSVGLALMDGRNRVGLGSVTICPNRPIPPVGAVIEVRYMYAIAGGGLDHSSYLGERDDIEATECTLGQLKYRPEGDAA